MVVTTVELRMTFCAMATSFVTSVLLSCVDRNGAFHPEQISEVNQPGVFSFGKFTDDEYSWAELPLFAILGIRVVLWVLLSNVHKAVRDLSLSLSPLSFEQEYNNSFSTQLRMA